MPHAEADYAQILSALKADFPAGTIFEIRTLSDNFNYRKLGCFTDPVRAADAIVNEDCTEIVGIYATLNSPVDDCLAKPGKNRLVKALKDSGTHNREIEYRRRLLVDVDPERPSNTSATEAERQAAHELAHLIDDYLVTHYGFPRAMIVDSGNGAHLKWETTKISNSEASDKLFKDFLHCLAYKFNQVEEGKIHVKVDTSVFDAARIARVPGTVARKGDEHGDRVHRVSKVLRPYDPFPLSEDLILKFVTDHAEITRKPLNGQAVTTFVYPEETKLYRPLEDALLANLDAWVPILLAQFRPYRSGTGWRIPSEAIGRPLQEDVSFTPQGIKDFGIHDMGDPMEGRRTPLQVLKELLTLDSIEQAVELAQTAINVPATEFHAEPINGMPAAMYQSPVLPLPEIGNTFKDMMARRHLYVKPDYLVDGLLLARQWINIIGFPKSGKSTWVRQLILCVICGLLFRGHSVKTGKVVLVTYEEHEDEIMDFLSNTLDWLLETQERWLTQEQKDAVFSKLQVLCLASQMQSDNETDRRLDQQRVEAQNELLPRGQPGLQALKAKVESDPEILLVVVDPKAELFLGQRMHRNPLIADRLEGIEIKKVINNSQAVIITVDHTNKQGGGTKASVNDVTMNTGGTTQLTAVATTTIALYRGWQDADNNKYALEVIKGRRVDQETFLRFNAPVGWTLKPEEVEVFEVERKNKVGAPKKNPMLQLEIHTLLSRNGEMSTKALMMALNTDYQIVRLELLRLLESGKVAVDRNQKEHQWFLTDTLGVPQIPGLPDIV